MPTEPIECPVCDDFGMEYGIDGDPNVYAPCSVCGGKHWIPVEEATPCPPS